MTVLVTGGAGYIGSHVIKCLKTYRKYGEEFEVLVLDNLSNGNIEALNDNCDKFYQGDIGDEELLDWIFTFNKVDAVVHLAALASVPDSVVNPAPYYETNVSKMKILLDHCVKYKIKNFVFASSAAVYGNPIGNEILTEGSLTNPINPYGFTKLIGENMLKDYEKAYGIKFCAFRFFCAAGDSINSVIGEAHNPETHLIPVAIKKKLANEKLTIFGDDYNTKDGTCIRDFVHVIDIADAHLYALLYLKDGGKSEIFNLGSGMGYSVKEIAETVGVEYEIADRREGDPAVLIASNDKAFKILNWIPHCSYLPFIVRTAEDWERNRKY